MLNIEKSLFDQGIKYIAGVDEVGRGPLAGPMVIGAVILDLESIFNITTTTKSQNYSTNDEIISHINNDVEYKKTYGKINDSKKVPEKTRIELEKFIKQNCLSFSIIEISNIELDNIGISQATQKAFFNSIKNLKIEPEHILTDAFKIKNIPNQKQTNLIKGDSLSISIASASIIAKVYRDALMTKLSTKYPVYSFDDHKGYGTKKHLEMIKKFGPCEIHRKSFEPIKSILLNKE